MNLSSRRRTVLMHAGIIMLIALDSTLFAAGLSVLGVTA